MTEQCFDSLNIYGKEPEQLENMILMFIHALDEYHLPEIQKAFIDWVKTNAEMPTPAGIIQVIMNNRPAHPVKYDHATPEEYAQAAEQKRNPKTVQWFGKTWENFTHDDKQKLSAHLKNLGKERAETYAIYLKDWCKVPKDFLSGLSI